ncbi:MAG: respiratory nitrate reductase subunit gamma [Desulfohalobiaceae bacterium]|nr:respiratory nitrate reductase subunit gamma [Desulfohalobiaceae bacterium]
MYDFLTGPALWLAFIVCGAGLLTRIVWYVYGLNWQLDRVAYTRHPLAGLKGALRSILHWLIPFAARNWRLRPLFTVTFFLFHLGLILVPLFLEGHAVLLEQGWGIAWPTIPMWLADALTLIALATGLAILVRRFALPEVRILTTGSDVLILILAMAPFLTGFLAVQQAPGYQFWLLTHIVTGEILLISIPFTRLSHMIMFFLTRAQIGMDFGIKRGGMKGRGIAW